MSLVGSLEDLGLGDILQIISLSRKSGILLLRSEQGEGQILFAQGLIRGAFVKGGPTALRELLAKHQVVAPEELEAAWQEARARRAALGEVLVARARVEAEKLDELRRDNIESAVLRMFGWPTGEFSFEVRDVDGDAGEELFVSPGINPQFLALEGTRLSDEGGDEPEDEEGEPVFAGEDAADDEPPFASSATPSEEGVVEAVPAEAGDDDVVETADHVVEAADGDVEGVVAAELAPEAAEGVDPFARAELAGPLDAEADDAMPAEADGATPGEEAAAEEAVAVLDEAPQEVSAAATRPAPDAAPALAPPVVAIDPDLAMLEWLKATLGEAHGAVHIFQRPDLGVERIRQYLARAQTPLVLLAADAPADAVAGGRDPYEMIARLKRQSARVPVLLLVPDGEEPPRAPRRAGAPGALPDAVVTKPSATQLADERCVRERELAAERLREGVAASLGILSPASGERREAGADAVARLKEVSARIRDRSSKGEVLPQVIAFAAQTFRRVVLFMVREQDAVALAQVGLARAGGPDAAGLRDLQLACREPGWFREVLDTRHPVRGAPGDAGDRRLASLLGETEPTEAYVAPLESGGQVVAILYADNLPDSAPLGDSAALEVVLHEAGMALDRAVLERALAEAEG